MEDKSKKELLEQIIVIPRQKAVLESITKTVQIVTSLKDPAEISKKIESLPPNEVDLKSFMIANPDLVKDVMKCFQRALSKSIIEKQAYDSSIEEMLNIELSNRLSKFNENEDCRLEMQHHLIKTILASLENSKTKGKPEDIHRQLLALSKDDFFNKYITMKELIVACGLNENRLRREIESASVSNKVYAIAYVEFLVLIETKKEGGFSITGIIHDNSVKILDFSEIANISRLELRIAIEQISTSLDQKPNDDKVLALNFLDYVCKAFVEDLGSFVSFVDYRHFFEDLIIQLQQHLDCSSAVIIKSLDQSKEIAFGLTKSKLITDNFKSKLLLQRFFDSHGISHLLIQTINA